MKAKIRMCKGMNDLVYYNEEKLSEREAECIYAGNFLKDAGDLSLKEKKIRFADLIDLNPQTIRPATSVVLEFAPGERLPDHDLIDIAREIMEGIGFASQPYLVYRHDDTAHQHMHLISTKIRTNGDPIPESFIGVRRLQPTARALEKKYHLNIKTPDGQPRHDPREKIQYGITETWQALSDTLQYVLENYHYRSIPELNAALRLYNLTVKNGAPGTRLHEHGGLIYQVLGEDGKPRNAPIKASDLPNKPTLKNLEPRFKTNRDIPAPEISAARYTLGDILRTKPATLELLTAQLRKNRLAAVPNFDRKGELIDLHIIDLSSKNVLTIADLGSSYTAANIRDKLGFEPFPAPAKRQALDQRQAITQQQTIDQRQTRQQKPSRGLHL